MSEYQSDIPPAVRTVKQGDAIHIGGATIVKVVGVEEGRKFPRVTLRVEGEGASDVFHLKPSGRRDLKPMRVSAKV